MSLKYKNIHMASISHTLRFPEKLLNAKNLSLFRIRNLRNSELEYYINNPN